MDEDPFADLRVIVGKDGISPAWVYDEDDYCVFCGNGSWKYHMPECGIADLLDKAREKAPPEGDA